MKKVSRILACVLTAFASVFFLYALRHPEAGWPWSNTVTRILYGLYALTVLILFIAPFGKKRAEPKT